MPGNGTEAEKAVSYGAMNLRNVKEKQENVGDPMRAFVTKMSISTGQQIIVDGL